MSQSQSTIARLDELIRAGQGHVVRQELARIRPNTVPRPVAADLANIARRVGLPTFSLQVLKPIVHPTFPLSEAASAREVAIYASALSRIGALDEALELLRGVAHSDTPEVLLFLSFAYIHQWNYASAVAPLKRYIRHPAVTFYDAFIAKLNLAAAYQFLGRHEPQGPLLVEIIATAREQGWQTLHKNALELAAQAALGREEWLRAEKLLTEAQSVSSTSVQSDFLIRKWRAIAALRQQGPTTKALAQVLAVREEATRLHDTETQRDCDFYQALITQNAELMAFVYFGTPYRHYRQRIARAAHTWFECPSIYEWHLMPGTGRRFDVRTARVIEGSEYLKPGQALHRLLMCLSADFYRPSLLGGLFARLYPGEYFDPAHSPARVRRMVERLRDWLSKNGIPLVIQQRNGLYHLEATGPCSLVVGKNMMAHSAEVVDFDQLQKLKQAWPYQNFAMTEAARLLDLPLHQVRALLHLAVEKKRAYVSGKARGTRFRFSK